MRRQTTRKQTARCLATLCVAALAFASAPAQAAAPGSESLASQAVEAGRDWIVKRVNNICGLKAPDQLSSPAKVDFQKLLAATPEMKELKDQKIRRDSPEGIRLITDATNRVTTACEKVRTANSHCSIWKAIRHKDGRQVPDVTAKVKALL